MGSAHLRRVLIESSWSYRHRPGVKGKLIKRQDGESEDVKAIAWKAQHRLHERYRRMSARGMLKPKVVTAVARELLGFVWTIGLAVENPSNSSASEAAACHTDMSSTG